MLDFWVRLFSLKEAFPGRQSCTVVRTGLNSGKITDKFQKSSIKFMDLCVQYTVSNCAGTMDTVLSPAAETCRQTAGTEERH